MVKIDLATIFYSKKNIDLAYRLHKICYKMCMNLVTCLNFVDMTIKTMQLRPQIIFFDLSTIEITSSQIRVLIENKEYRYIKLVFIGDESHQKFFQDLKLDGVEFVLSKDLEHFLINSVNLLNFNAFKMQKYESENAELSSEITKLLFSLGFSPKHSGYCFLKEIINEVVANGGVMKSLLNDHYPFIAVKYKTTVSNIERNIRNAISIAFKNSKTNWQDIFNVYNFCDDEKRPTNREFIGMCSDMLLCNNIRQMKA